ncbi:MULTISPECIES: hypothetical protein [Sorangium]|uniref:VanZ-like domain-containing protein n=1 Tax=Sorangium cellulosum (strain So ce56) TaxID=448385 RepID=A9F946_SORC5|nr:hypothetical protein [Sorangium cellulosum]CAN94719.1 hypothetical protein predicted by Glimmer/Critica [Sorangium cellulosum So ce56]
MALEDLSWKPPAADYQHAQPRYAVRMTTARTSQFRLLLWIQLPLFAAAAAGAYLGLLPTSLPSVPHADLAAHALGFGLLALCVDGALGYRPILRRGPAFPPLGPALVLAGAGLEELAQGLSPRRTSSLADFAADAAGVLVLSWLARPSGSADAPPT